MATASSRTIEMIEQKLESIDPGSSRGQVLKLAKQFKSHWIELGQALSKVLNQRLFAEWGYATFERYVSSELHIKKETAHKLVRGYAFIEEKKPEYLAPERWDRVPAVETVDFLSRIGQNDDVALNEPIAAVTENAFAEAWSPRMVSQRWRDLVGESSREEKSDPATRAVGRARELAERLNRTLTEIPGLDARALDAVTTILESLERIGS